jgi:hypothetical protein
LEQDHCFVELLLEMQQSMDNMSVIARELCEALGVDVESLLDEMQDQADSTSSYDTSAMI